MALYAQGREPLEDVNRLRLFAGMPSITNGENARCVTWTMLSKHIINLDDSLPDNDKARAFDFVILDKTGRPTWSDKVDIDLDKTPDYVEAGIVGEGLGLVWGGRWKRPKTDSAHLQVATTS
jgi:hypothetical protein